MSYPIRLLGDPVLRQVAVSVEEIDDKIARMVEDMVPSMYAADGIGLAAPQVGIQKRLFVYDIGEVIGRHTIGLKQHLHVHLAPLDFNLSP